MRSDDTAPRPKRKRPVNRLQKAYRLLASERVARQENGTYVVLSESSERYYTITPGHPATCTCPDYTHRALKEPGFRCAHIWAARIAELVRLTETVPNYNADPPHP